MGTVSQQPKTDNVHAMFIGAHPDDADIKFGGTAIRLLEAGHAVTYVSVTNGDAGHHKMDRPALAKRRLAETQAVAEFLGIQYLVLNNHDGQLQASLENRHQIVQLIREQRPNVIITHRPNDYHADHRQTSLLVQDAAYLVAVPLICPDIPRLEYNPVILYHADSFTKPQPFTPNVLVDITSVVDKKIEALSHHESQVFEWLPFIEGQLDEVTALSTPEEKQLWLKQQRENSQNVTRFWPQLVELVGEAAATKIKHLEAFEACEYGQPLTAETAARLFPFGLIRI